jgi:Mrp family chromosome partitioning ATPase
MKELISRLELVFDSVIIDAPPLLPVTDAAVLSQHVGGVALVVGAQKVRQQDLRKSLDALEMVGAKVLGVVLNKVPAKGPDAYAYGYYSNADRPGNKSSTGRTPNKLTVGDAPPGKRVAAAADPDVAFVRSPSVFPANRFGG